MPRRPSREICYKNWLAGQGPRWWKMFVEFIVPIVITISDRRTLGICHQKTEVESGSSIGNSNLASFLQIVYNCPQKPGYRGLNCEMYKTFSVNTFIRQVMRLPFRIKYFDDMYSFIIESTDNSQQMLLDLRRCSYDKLWVVMSLAEQQSRLMWSGEW